MKQERFGAYTAVEGKLDPQDSRAAYVEGPAIDGTIRPLASFWYYSEAVAWAKAAARPLAVGDRCKTYLPKLRELDPYEAPRRAFGTITALGSHHAIVRWDDPEHAATLPQGRHGLDSIYKVRADEDPALKVEER